jgi:hypothetical protein
MSAYLDTVFSSNWEWSEGRGRGPMTMQSFVDRAVLVVTVLAIAAVAAVVMR